MNYALPLLLSLAPFAALADNQACHNTDEAQVAALFDRWNADLQSGDPQRVVENYAPDSLLLPTVSNTPRQTPQDKLDYFEHFLELKPKGEIVSRMIMIDCNSALDTGLYSFQLGDGSVVPARYTFSYRWFDQAKQWLITSHHSSAMPHQTAAHRSPAYSDRTTSLVRSWTPSQVPGNKPTTNRMLCRAMIGSPPVRCQILQADRKSACRERV